MDISDIVDFIIIALLVEYVKLCDGISIVCLHLAKLVGPCFPCIGVVGLLCHILVSERDIAMSLCFPKPLSESYIFLKAMSF